MRTKVWEIGDKSYLLLTDEKEQFAISNDYERIENLFFMQRTVGEAWDNFFDGIWKEYARNVGQELLMKKELIRRSGVGLYVVLDGKAHDIENKLVQSLDEGLECFELTHTTTDFSIADHCEISDIFLNTKRLIEFEILEHSDKEISSRTSFSLTILAMIYLQL